MKMNKKISLVATEELFRVIQMAHEIKRRDNVSKGLKPPSMNQFLLGLVEEVIYERPHEIAG